MHRWPALVILALGLLHSAVGKAEGADGPELGLRTGYAVPSGRIGSGLRLREVLTFALPVHIDLGYRINDWFIGGYGQYALAFESATARSTCPGCTHSWLRLGLQAQYSLHHSGNMGLWVGVASGQQWLNSDINKDRREASQALGYEYVVTQLGSALSIAEGVTLGPFATLSLGEYVRLLQTCQNDALCPATRQRVESRTQGAEVHLWFITGVRATLLP